MVTMEAAAAWGSGGLAAIRRLDQVDTGALVARLGVLRREAALVRRQLRPGTVPDATLASLVEAIDRSALLITGRSAADLPQ